MELLPSNFKKRFFWYLELVFEDLLQLYFNKIKLNNTKNVIIEIK